MASLEYFGVQPVDQTLSTHGTWSEISPDDFHARSSELLTDLAMTVRSDVIPHLELYPARLHPSGFSVQLLGTHPLLGDLRLHMYPPDMAELREPLGMGKVDTDVNGYPIYDGAIHEHSWGVTGLSFYAEPADDGMPTAYVDRMYRVEEVPDVSIEHALATDGLFRVFEARYAPDEPVRLKTDNMVARAVALRDRRIDVGNTHFIPPDTVGGDCWHAPTPPVGKLVVTLAFTSHRMIEGGPHVLIGGPEPQYSHERRTVPPSVLANAKVKILALQ